jgi:hypothetical protein
MSVFKLKDLYRLNSQLYDNDTLNRLTPTATDGQIAAFNDSEQAWELVEVTDTDTLGKLKDSASDGQIAQYDSSLGAWKLVELVDTDTDTFADLAATALDGQYIVFDENTNAWITTDLTTSSGNDTLTTLAASATDGQIVKYSSATQSWELTVSAGAEVYNSVTNPLPMSGVRSGTIAFVTDTNRMYIWKGNVQVGAWYEIAYVNESPVFTTGVNTEESYELSAFGASIDLTLAAFDPEGVPLIWSFVENDPFNVAVVANNGDGSYSISADPDAISNSRGGTATISFTVTDGKNIASETGSFVLSFVSTITTNPQVVGSYLTADNINLQNAELYGNYVIGLSPSVSNQPAGWSQMYVFDVTNNNPVIAGQFNPGSSVDFIKISGDVMYMMRDVSTSTAEFVAVDLSDLPNSISILGRLNNTTNFSADNSNTRFDIDASRNIAYVVGDIVGAISIVDISDPSNLAILSSFRNSTTFSQPRKVAYYGNYAYAIYTSSFNRIAAFDTSNTAAITRVDTTVINTSGPTQTGGLVGYNGYLYAYGNKFDIFDLTDPTTPSLISTRDDIANLNTIGGVRDMSILNGYAFIVRTDGSFAVLDLSDPANPTITGSLPSATLDLIPFRVMNGGSKAYALINGTLDGIVAIG